MSFELRHENIDSNSLPILDNDVPGGEAGKNQLPHGWYAMPEECEIEEGKLKDALYESRDLAAQAVGNLFSKIGVGIGIYDHIYKIPVGLMQNNKEPDDAGDYLPGVYAVFCGEKSDDVCDLNDLLGYGDSLDEEDIARLKRRIAGTMAHEMVHSVQTVSNVFNNFIPDGLAFVNLGGDRGAIPDWEGLTEGMAEALGFIAMNMYLKNMELSVASEALEEECRKRQAPATQLSARMVRKMDPELLKWYLTCAQTGSYKGENKLQGALGSDYTVFLKNLNRLYEIEVSEQPMKPSDVEITQQMEKIIDEKMAQQH